MVTLASCGEKKLKLLLIQLLLILLLLHQLILLLLIQLLLTLLLLNNFSQSHRKKSFVREGLFLCPQMDKNRKIASFLDHFPPKVAEYCFNLWDELKFEFIITKKGIVNWVIFDSPPTKVSKLPSITI